MTKSGTGTWDLGRGDVGTWGLGDVGTWGRGDVGTWDNGTKSPRKLNCLCYFAFQVPAKYTAKFKNWILEKSFSPPVTELECETKQKT